MAANDNEETARARLLKHRNELRNSLWPKAEAGTRFRDLALANDVWFQLVMVGAIILCQIDPRELAIRVPAGERLWCTTRAIEQWADGIDIPPLPRRIWFIEQVLVPHLDHLIAHS